MKPYLKYALLSAGIGAAITLSVYVAGLDKTESGQYFGWISFAATIVLMVLCVKETRTVIYNGFITFGEAFGTLMKMILISTALSGVFMYVYTSVINPSLIDYTREQQALEMEKKGMTTEAIDQAMVMSEKFTTPVMMSVWVILGGLLIGTICSLIIAAIMKKQNPETIS